MKLINEEHLLISLKAGEAFAFDRIYTAYSKMLYTYLYARLDDQDLCSDILQDVFISLWEKRETIRIEASLKSYLFQAIKYKITDQYRRNYKYQKYLTELGDYVNTHFTAPVDNIDQKNQLKGVMHTIDGFPCRMKEIFILSRFEHLSVNSIAEKLSISPQTVKNQLTKALSILREHHAETYLTNIAILTFLLEKLK